ncbi:MAG TPA: hypothetical protein VGC42_15935 [Kofleriaceae bacterium]
MLLLDERIKADGTHARTWALGGGDHVELRDDDGASGRLSAVAVDRVMVRYGRPLEADVGALDGEAIDVGPYRLRRMRYHARVDAEGRDYLVWERPDGEPLACVAAMVTAALRYLTLRLADRSC